MKTTNRVFVCDYIGLSMRLEIYADTCRCNEMAGPLISSSHRSSFVSTVIAKEREPKRKAGYHQ